MSNDTPFTVGAVAFAFENSHTVSGAPPPPPVVSPEAQSPVADTRLLLALNLAHRDAVELFTVICELNVVVALKMWSPVQVGAIDCESAGAASDLIGVRADPFTAVSPKEALGFANTAEGSVWRYCTPPVAFDCATALVAFATNTYALPATVTVVEFVGEERVVRSESEACPDAGTFDMRADTTNAAPSTTSTHADIVGMYFLMLFFAYLNGYGGVLSNAVYRAHKEILRIDFVRTPVRSYSYPRAQNGGVSKPYIHAV